MAIKQLDAVQAMEEITGGKVVAASLSEVQGAWLALHRHVLTAVMLVMLAAVWITARKYA